jgi:hypothetical protein
MLGPGCPEPREEIPRPRSLVLADPRDPDVIPTYLAVCPERAIPELMPLAEWRCRNGQTVRIAPAEAIYNAFGDGRPAPEAIRAFVASLPESPQRRDAPRFLLLVGTADRANREGLFLPTWITKARFQTDKAPAAESLAGDFHYAAPAGSPVPDIAVGRLPARSLEELRVMVRKTLTFERNSRPGPWRRQVDIFAGQGGFGRLVDPFLERVFSTVLAEHVPDYLTVRVAYANPSSPYCYAPRRFGKHVVERLNAGPAMTVYVGHAWEDRLAEVFWRGRAYPILDVAAVEAVKIPDNRTTMTCIACWTGRYDGPVASIGERLFASPRGPALFIGASRVSQPYANAILAALLAEAFLTAPPPTAGEAFLKAQRWLAQDRRTGFRAMVDLIAMTQLGFSALPAQRADQLLLYNLLGDPALSLSVVRTPASLDAPQSARAGQVVQVRMEGPVAVGTAHFSLSIHRDRTLAPLRAVPTDHPQAESEMIRTNARANDKVVAEGRAPIRAGRAVWQLGIPGDCPAGQFHVNVYAQGPDHDAAASRPIRIEPAAGPGIDGS